MEEIREEYLGVFYFRSGVAQPVNGVSGEDAQKILQENELVSKCEFLAGTFISVELKRPLGPHELREFKNELRENGIEFYENKRHYPLNALAPIKDGPV